MHRLMLSMALPLAVVIALLQGCSKPTECPEATTIVKEVPVIEGEESYDCSHLERAGSAQTTWCEAQNRFSEGSFADDERAFKEFLMGYRGGVNDARQAKDSRYNRFPVEGREGKPEEAGYRAGYKTAISDMGVIEYDCASNEGASEYKDRWCEASDSFRSAGLGGDNPFIKGRFIDGYMSGGRVALTVPTSMESFFSGDGPEGKQTAIVKPEGTLKKTEEAFYRGFDEGYKAMIASIRESINQVMQQMQVPNMPGGMPDGMMPPMDPNQP